MEIIDKSRTSDKERLETEVNDQLEDVVKQKQANTSKKYVPNQEEINYLDSLRKNILNREGKSKEGGFGGFLSQYKQWKHVIWDREHT